MVYKLIFHSFSRAKEKDILHKEEQNMTTNFLSEKMQAMYWNNIYKVLKEDKKRF